MSRAFEFHPEARSEFRAAVKYYESERRGVGREFADHLRAAVNEILTHPMSGTPGKAGTRRRIVGYFPYTLVYMFEGALITIVAVAHHRRRPGYWRDRL